MIGWVVVVDELFTLDDVLAQLEDPPSEDQKRMIRSMIGYTSDLVRQYGNPAWTADSVPGVARRIAVACHARWARNPDAFTTSRSADETVMWEGVEEPGAPRLYKDEKARLGALKPSVNTSGALMSVQTWQWDARAGGRERDVSRLLGRWF